MYEKILVATDGSDASLKASEHGVKLAQSQGAGVLALYVINEAAISSVISSAVLQGTSKDDLRAKMKETAEKAVGEVAKMCESAGVEVEPLVREGDAAGKIVETAEINGADVIVLGSHGESGVTSKLIGSIAQKVLIWSELPVIVVR